uniref:Variant surface glycoprotein 1125.2009 n=1 Tax=Trypanosoma brucei TaxID=5691 RepID=A0A1J0R7W9_9TRYP|nr:variant surface glycoprotein 1125.2009 [Trypanosoma brucei]
MCLILSSIMAPQAIAKLDTAGAKVTDLCTEAKYVTALAQIFRQEADRISRGQTTLMKAATAYRLSAAAATDAKQIQGFQALELVATQKLNQYRAQATAAIDKKLKAANVLESRAMKIIQTQRLQIKSAQPKPATTANNSGTWPTGSTVQTTIEHTLRMKSDVNCTVDKLDDSETIKQSEVNHRQLTALPLAEDSAFEQTALRVLVVSKGTPANTHSSGGGAAAGVVSQDGTSYTALLGGKIETISAEEKPETTNLFKDAEQRTTCAEHTLKQEWALHSREYVLTVVCAATTAAEPETTDPMSWKLENLKTNKELALLLREVAGISENSAAMEPAAITKIIQGILGTTEQEYETKFVKYVNAESREYTIGDKQLKGSFLEMANNERAPELLAHLLGKKAWTKQQNCNDAPKEVAKDEQKAKCQSITEKSKCTADKDCEYKDGKCQTKEGVKAENDDKTTTNTTGNNSFVIKKAPLSLVFSIL